MDPSTWVGISGFSCECFWRPIINKPCFSLLVHFSQPCQYEAFLGIFHYIPWLLFLTQHGFFGARQYRCSFMSLVKRLNTCACISDNSSAGDSGCKVTGEAGFVPPGKLTCPLKKTILTEHFILQPSTLRGYDMFAFGGGDDFSSQVIYPMNCPIVCAIAITNQIRYSWPLEVESWGFSKVRNIGRVSLHLFQLQTLFITIWPVQSWSGLMLSIFEIEYINIMYPCI